jgi:hypothetical protein
MIDDISTASPVHAVKVLSTVDTAGTRASVGAPSLATDGRSVLFVIARNRHMRSDRSLEKQT